jgi:hypothetical protein
MTDTEQIDIAIAEERDQLGFIQSGPEAVAIIASWSCVDTKNHRAIRQGGSQLHRQPGQPPQPAGIGHNALCPGKRPSYFDKNPQQRGISLGLLNRGRRPVTRADIAIRIPAGVPYGRQPCKPLQHLYRCRSKSYQIPQYPVLVDTSAVTHIIQHGLESDGVAM